MSLTGHAVRHGKTYYSVEWKRKGELKTSHATTQWQAVTMGFEVSISAAEVHVYMFDNRGQFLLAHFPGPGAKAL